MHKPASRRIDARAIRPSDGRVLQALLRFHFLTPEQLTRLLFSPGAKNHVYEKLHRLANGKHVRAIPMLRPQPRGASRLLYTLARSGLTHLRELGIEVPEGFRLHEPKQFSFLFYDHQLAVADVLIAATLLERQASQVRLRRFVHDRELARRPVAITLADGESVKLVPDAFLSFGVTLADTQGRFHVLWEVDRGTVDLRSWRKRIRGYLAGLADGILTACFEVSPLTIAITVPDRRRQQELLSLIGAVAEADNRAELADLVLVTAADPARTPVEEFFLAPIFVVPLTGELVPLLDHEALERPVFLLEKGGV